MYKSKLESVAKSLASKNNLQYGHCVFDGFFYVGTKQQLEEIGVIII